MTANLSVAVTEDEMRARIVLETADARIVLTPDATELSALIETLGEARTRLRPEVPRTIDGATPIRIVEPAVLSALETEAADGGRTIALRHPAFGWWAVSLSPDVAERLAAALTAPLTAGPSRGPLQ